MLTDKDIMPFGKHAGELMQDVPAKYLLYIYDSSMISAKYSDVRDYIEANIDVLKQQAKFEKY